MRKTNAFSTCFYTVFLLRDCLSFCLDSLNTYSSPQSYFHTRRLFIEIACQITQVPQEFDTRFLSFYTTCAVQYTCRLRTLPHKAPWNLFRSCSSFRVLLVSCSKALAVAILMSLSLSFSLQILTVVALNLSLTGWPFSSFALRACTSSLSSGASASSSLAALSFGSQSRPRV